MEKIPPEKYVDIKMLSEISNVLDIRDKTILRYEMIREYEATTQTAEQMGRKYGYSRTRFHEFKLNFENRKLPLVTRFMKKSKKVNITPLIRIVV